MRIGATRFWRDGMTIRASNYETQEQPIEFGLCKYWRLPGFKFYEDEAERGGTQVRLSVELLWFYVNALIAHTSKETRRWDDSGRQWGFYFMDRINFVWRWGKKYVSFDLPFISKVFVNHQILSLDRSRVVFEYKTGRFMDDYAQSEEVKSKNRCAVPYRYETLKGEAQDVTATVVVERWIRRWKWTPFKSVDDSIWATFSEDIGSGRGSWKGGCTGCGYSMKRGETVVQCLRRMERERRFDR